MFVFVFVLVLAVAGGVLNLFLWLGSSLPKLNPGLDQRTEPLGVAATWHSSETWMEQKPKVYILIIIGQHSPSWHHLIYIKI